MKVYIKNVWDLVREDSEVTNENNEPVFTVRGNYFSFGKKKKIYAINGTHLYTVRNRIFNFLSYKVYVDDAEGKRVATVKKGMFSISGKYKILDTEDKMAIDGNFFGRKSFITRNGEDVASVTKEFTFFVDAYVLAADEKDIPFFTALVIALDNLRDKRQRNN